MNHFEDQLNSIVKKHQENEKNLSEHVYINSDDLIKLNKEYSDLKPIVDSIKQFNFQISGIKYVKNKNTNYGRCRARFS